MRTRERARFWGTIRAFVHDRAASVAILFALGFLAIAAGTLVAIDLTRAQTIRGDLQDALDSATLATAVSKLTDPKQIDKLGDNFLAAQFSHENISQLESTFKPTDKAIVADATAKFTPYFMGGVFKKSSMDLKAHSEVLRDYDSAVTELVLVLDTTGSMQGDKIAALKTAANDLVNKVTASPNNKIRIGVIPFGQYVNIGQSRRNQPWADVPADYTETIYKDETKTETKSKTTCATPGTPYTCTKYNDGAPYQATCTTAATNCTTTYYNPPLITITPASTTKKNHKWNGCIGSPPYPQNIRDSDLIRKYPGIMDVTCGTEITPLTPSKSVVTKAINALNATGNTYIPSGLAWGFNALSSGDPLTEAAAYDTSKKNSKPRKVLVLMTDGDNTLQMRHTAAGSSPAGAHDLTGSAEANKYTTELCNNIKDAKIELFTIAFQVSTTETKGLLEACASDRQHYFDASNSAGLNAAFQAIADALQVVRISK